MMIPDFQTLPKNGRLAKKDLIIEVELNGKMKFDHLLHVIYQQTGICYKVLSVNVEYMNGANFGSFQLHIKANEEESQELEFFLNKHKLMNTTVDYTCRKYS
ncbi:cysteine methyltransferase [Chryseobacterium wangxinyae]|uniref:cysteine methyltransferase n=1 Tax=Chryseobacterium sp. CY350 TaxID=2997336 RepID=UPI00226EEA11|nr:cysteine methyltransferase [Chryseobacterium sp. CY350]MCY0979032.1 cysteine methyltransferase [Chryseobacterium sp. CY350]WBZ97241.1 cysteine methyltransferase [Chryseobacterium sp. CY350]